MEVSFISPGTEPPLLIGYLGGPQSRYRRYGEKKNRVSLPEIEPRSSRRLRETRNTCTTQAMKPLNKRSLGRPRGRWKNRFKMDVHEIGCEDWMWMELAQDCAHFWTVPEPNFLSERVQQFMVQARLELLYRLLGVSPAAPRQWSQFYKRITNFWSGPSVIYTNIHLHCGERLLITHKTECLSQDR
jgi:truncated hemoglobin YjbI